MAVFLKPVPFAAAADWFARKFLMPTTLNSRELRALGEGLFRQAFTSATVENERVLAAAFGEIQNILEQRGNTPQARLTIQQMLRDTGYEAAPDAAGTIRDLGTRARQDLIVETNLATARGRGQWLVANDPAIIDTWPALELYRAEDRNEERDWNTRWMMAAQTAGDVLAAGALGNFGRLAALKDSPIWPTLGTMFDDSLGNPWPPFAWGSGMDTRELPIETARALGLVPPGAVLKPGTEPNP